MLQENEKTISNILKKYIDPYHTISIIGTAKNAGKTTVLNQIIKEYKNQIIALSSIGLDGEKIDNITFRLKPRIEVYPQTIIATANDCLKECYFAFKILEKTSIRTPLGEIIIIEALTKGLALIAGPSTINSMMNIIDKFKKYNVTKILIDGALFRKSIASFKIADAAILSTGASYSRNVDKVVEDTTLILEELMLKTVDDKLYTLLEKEKELIVMDKIYNKTIIKLDTLLNNEKKVKKYLTKNSKYLYLPGALSNKLIQVVINKRFELKELTIIVKDATHIIADTLYLEKLKLTNTKLLVINKINVLFLTYNPHSSKGYEFDNDEFKQKLKQKIKLPIINVLKDVE